MPLQKLNDALRNGLSFLDTYKETNALIKVLNDHGEETDKLFNRASRKQHENTIRSVQKALVRALLDSCNVEGAERQLQSISRQCTEQDTVEDGDDLLPLQVHLYVYKGDYTNAEQLRRKLLQKSKNSHEENNRDYATWQPRKRPQKPGQV